ncbi:YihY/virulence factor BrkB family protein [Oligoflexus tunisiensis]|uniref:YihY/virulence factor BrkB family protein n=1 Tax=Oligoflexus tunisiensis TaxID=708132 RepID=UPI000AE60F45|nr:YihY/virulence factor BrkB family protein [Oligoflexus tunisiensis]
MKLLKWKTWKDLLKDTFNLWLDVSATRLGAALSYYSVFSLGPMLIIAIAIAAFFFGEEAARGEIFNQLRGIIGDAGAASVELLVKASSKPVSGGIAAVSSLLTLFIGATGVVVQLKDALNTIWGVRAKPGRTLKVFLRTYVLSIASLLGLGFILVVSLMASTILQVIGDYMGGLLPFSDAVLGLINFLFSFSMISLLFALIFKVLPDVEIRWKDVIPAALFTGIMFTIGKSLVGLYLGTQSLDSSYGAAASVVVILLWVYYLAQVLFFGACFSKIYALHQGQPIEVSEDVQFEKPAPPPLGTPGLQS